MAKKVKFNTVPGFSDILPKDSDWWKMIFSAGDDISDIHDFHYMDTSLVEYADLFNDSLKDDLPGIFDVEASSLEIKINGKKTKKLSLRANGAVALIRSYMENHLGYFSSPLRSYYRGPVFLDNKKKDSFQEYEWGFQIIGSGEFFYDVDIMLVIRDFLKKLGVPDPLFKLNAVGCRVCRPKYYKKVKNYYKDHKDKLCKVCTDHHKRSSLGVLKCINERCLPLKDGAPVMLDSLCQSCNNHFQGILELVEDNEVNYLPDPYFVDVPGIYSKVVFGVSLSEDSEVIGVGGRQDYLSESIGGRQIPSVGGSLNINKVIESLDSLGIEPKAQTRRKVFFVAVGKEAKKVSSSLIYQLRQTRIAVEESIAKKTLGAQLKVAEKSGVNTVLILGQKEIYDNSVIIRNLETNVQETIPQEKFLDEVRERL